MEYVDARVSRARESYTITYPSPDETLLGTPEALPTSEPATAQIEYTIAASHLPTVSPAGLEYVLTAILYAAGKNTDTVARTAYYRILKNGASVATGSASVEAGYFYTWNHYNLYGVQVGDVLACKLWATGANVNWDYKALAVMPTRMGPANMLLRDVALTIGTYPTLARGTPSAQSTFAFQAYHLDGGLFSGVVADKTFGYLATYPVYRLGTVYLGDYQCSWSIAKSTTIRPNYYRNYVPTAISFRPLTIRV